MRLRPKFAAPRLAGGSACPTAIVGLLLGLCVGAYAAGQDPLHRDSPQSSVTAFLAACQARDYQRAWRYMDLRKLPAAQRLNAGTELAKQLQQILDRDVQFDLAALTGDPEGNPPGTNQERVDSFNVDGKPAALELERVTVRSGAKIWVLSSASVDLIPRIARLASDSPIEKYLPEPLVSWKLIDTSLWRWIALLLLAAALAALAMLASKLTLLWMQPSLKRAAPRMHTDLLEVLLGPLRLLLAVLGFRVGLEWIDPSPVLRLYLGRGAGLLFFLAIAWLGMRITDLLVVRLRGLLGAKQQTFSYSVLPLASRVVKIVIVAVTVAALLSSWGYNTGAILAGLGVGGIALALAAQKTIENLFGGVAVITDRPVTIGDFCKVGDKMGTVEDIGLRSTRIRTLDRTLLTVPNGQFSSMTLENFSQRDKMWFHLMLNLRRDTTSAQMRTLLESITQALKKDPKVETGPIPVRFVGVGTYSLDVEIFAYILTLDGDEFTRIQQELFLWILDAVEAAGTGLAVPTQAYYSMARTPHQNGAPVAQETGAEKERGLSAQRF
jgi:MscS family membrane protein